MPSTNGSGRDAAQRQEQLRQNEHRRQQRRGATGTAQQRQAEQLQGLMNPEIIDTLLKAQDIRDGANSSEIDEALSPFLHPDAVLSNFDDTDIWERSWAAKRRETFFRISHPPEQSQVNNERSRAVLERIHGDVRAPMQHRDKERLRALTQRMRDRVRRASNGQFAELLLREGVDIRESSAHEGGSGGGLFSGVLGGD